MKNIVVTGAAGFIGSHLCERLVKYNRVYGIDDLITGDICNIENLYNNKNFEFIRQDVTYHAVAKALSSQINWRHIDEIYYLASIASPVKYLKFPLETIAVNTVGLQNFLEIGINNRTKFLYTSTSEVYGTSLDIPFKESNLGQVNTIGSRAVYDESKRLGETLVSTYNRKYGIDSKIIRIHNTYGPRMAKYDGRVIPNFIMQCLENRDITIYGDGKQTRSFCYIDDMVDGIIKAMAYSYNKPINLGNPQEHFSIFEIAQIIKTQIEKKSKIIYVNPISEDDPTKRIPDITLAQSQLKWNPKVTLDVGLGKTIKYFRGLL